VAVVGFDGVVLSDLATPCDVFGRGRDFDGRPRYEVRVCGVRRKVRSEHLSLEVPWSLNTLQRAGTIIVPGIDPIDISLWMSCLVYSDAIEFSIRLPRAACETACQASQVARRFS